MNSVRPNQYDIEISPNFDDFTFSGETSILMTTAKPTKELTLNAVNLTIKTCKLNSEGKKIDLSYNLDPNNEELHINLPELISGTFTIDFSYEGEIKDDLKGLYKTTYKIDKEIHAGAITQFETEDARRMFPCFDEPAMKATFNLKVLVDQHLTAISNTNIKSESKLSSGKRWVTFQTTPKMSTYLLFLAIAEFESIDDKIGDIKVRVITHPGLTKYAKESLDFAKKSLEYCQNYFKIPYPISKLDLISTPDFAAGAMENWGAISFREDLLLKFPGSTSTINEVIILNVIAHEITHQWFGNLVSPSLWSYLWLNESFANFFANMVLDHYRPEIKIWDQVVLFETNEALKADAYSETVPIEIEDQKKTSYNIKSVPIIYNKGGAILRMVEIYIGEKDFQTGMHAYLTKHAYSVASSDDLWTALEETSKKPISIIMKSWVLQMGYPLVTVVKEGITLKFRQERFTYLNNTSQTIWMIPLTVMIITSKGERIQKNFLLDKQEGSFNVGFSFTAFKVNIENTGFYRVKYTEGDLKILGKYVSENKLSSLDCWNLVSDIFALVKSGKINLNFYLDFILNYNNILLNTSLMTISENIIELFHLANGKTKDMIALKGIEFHENILNKINLEPQPEEPITTAVMRNRLIWNSAQLGSDKVTKFGLQKFEELKAGKQISPDILYSILAIGARKTNDFDWFMKKFETVKNEVELIYFGMAFGEFSDEKIINKVLDEIVFSKIPMRNMGGIITELCMNPTARSNNKLWKFFIANLDNVGKLNDFIQPMVINSIITNPSVDEETKNDMEKFFSEYNKQNLISKATTEKSFETVLINLELKKRLS